MKELACHEDEDFISFDGQHTSAYDKELEENNTTYVVQDDPEEQVFAFVAPDNRTLSEDNPDTIISVDETNNLDLSSHLPENLASPNSTRLNYTTQPAHKYVHFLTPIKSPSSSTMNIDDNRHFHPFNTPGPASKFSLQSPHSPKFTISSRDIQPSIYTDDTNDLNLFAHGDSSDQFTDYLNFASPCSRARKYKMHSPRVSIDVNFDAENPLLKPFSTPGPIYRSLPSVYSSALFNGNDSSLMVPSSDDPLASFNTLLDSPLRLLTTDLPPSHSEESAVASGTNDGATWAENNNSSPRSLVDLEDMVKPECRKLYASDSPGTSSLMLSLDLIPEIAYLRTNDAGDADFDANDELRISSSQLRLSSAGNGKHQCLETLHTTDMMRSDKDCTQAAATSSVSAYVTPATNAASTATCHQEMGKEVDRQNDIDAATKDSAAMGITTLQIENTPPKKPEKILLPPATPKRKRKQKQSERQCGSRTKTLSFTRAYTNTDACVAGSGIGLAGEADVAIDVDVSVGVEGEGAIVAATTEEMFDMVIDPIEDWED